MSASAPCAVRTLMPLAGSRRYRRSVNKLCYACRLSAQCRFGGACESDRKRRPCVPSHGWRAQGCPLLPPFDVLLTRELTFADLSGAFIAFLSSRVNSRGNFVCGSWARLGTVCRPGALEALCCPEKWIAAASSSILVPKSCRRHRADQRARQLIPMIRGS